MPQATREKFILFLENTYRGKMTVNSRDEEADFAEYQLIRFLRNYIVGPIQSIYDCINSKQLDDIYKLLSSQHSVSDLAQQEYGDMLPKVLRDYINYLGSKYFEQSDKIVVFPPKTPKVSSDKPLPDDTLPPDTDDDDDSEGKPKQVSVTKYERKSKHRNKALQHYGYTCKCCKMEFEKVYGEIGKEYIEVHHLDPVSNYDDEHKFDPLDPERGLVPLCSNCHSMIHRGGKDIKHPLSLKELEEIYLSHKSE